MGKEATCKIRHNGREWTAKAHLDGEELVVRGENRLLVRLRREAEVSEGWLRIPTPEGELALELGEQAERWAKSIVNPPTLLDKLGIKPAMQIAAIGFADLCWLECFSAERELAQGKRYDAILFHADTDQTLAQVPRLVEALEPKGMLWIVFPKGRKDITDLHVFAAGKAAGLVDVKVCKFNALLTGLKFVRRKA